ncbi:MAG: hypothetical protein IH840_00175 [Candidatus Heimdallarchaeota archaeon]|nr:hypothetical protein [Candidatus Heimdallarchaeota archaeon]
MIDKLIHKAGFQNRLEVIDHIVDSGIDKALEKGPKIDAIYQRYRNHRSLSPPIPGLTAEVNNIKQDFLNFLPMINKALADFKIDFKKELLADMNPNPDQLEDQDSGS